MARKRTTRNGSEEGQITVGLAPEELIQLKNICTILQAPSIEGLCLGFIRDGILQETQGILAHLAQSKVPLGDQETDLSSSTLNRTRDACGPVCDPNWTAPTQDAFRLKRNPKRPFPDELDPPDLDNQGLRGGTSACPTYMQSMGRFSGPVSDPPTYPNDHLKGEDNEA